MPQEFRPANPEQVEYKAFARHFENDESDEASRRAVLYVFATMTYPDSGWQFLLAQQADEPDTWVLLEDEPGYRDADRTYYVASGSSEHELEAVPKVVRVKSALDKITSVSVVPWD